MQITQKLKKEHNPPIPLSGTHPKERNRQATAVFTAALLRTAKKQNQADQP